MEYQAFYKMRASYPLHAPTLFEATAQIDGLEPMISDDRPFFTEPVDVEIGKWQIKHVEDDTYRLLFEFDTDFAIEAESADEALRIANSMNFYIEFFDTVPGLNKWKELFDIRELDDSSIMA